MKNKKHNLKRFWSGRLVLVVLAPFLSVQIALASALDDQINAAQNAVNGTQGQVSNLKGQVNTLQGQVDTLSGQISNLQGQINSTQAQIDTTNAKITQTEADLAARKTVLNALIRANYEQGQTSTLEVLASSSTLGQFFTKQQYILSLKDRIDQIVTQIKQTQLDLENAKGALAAQQTDLQRQQSLVSQSEAEQQQLLDVTQGQEANYQSLLKGQLSQLSALLALRASAGAHYGGTGGYPAVWANAPQDSLVDDWYYYNRECVSYAAWRRAVDGRPTPGYGNAAQWPVNTQTPQAGEVAVWGYSIGAFGHVAYVNSVNGDGSINVSQYNWGLQGEFSTMTVSPGSSLWPSKGFLN